MRTGSPRRRELVAIAASGRSPFEQRRAAALALYATLEGSSRRAAADELLLMLATAHREGADVAHQDLAAAPASSGRGRPYRAPRG